VSLKGEMPLGAGKLLGYVEADFMNPPPQNPLRFRLYYGSYTVGNWEFSAGQEWSLLRPNRVGISTLERLMGTRVVDSAYHVGLLGYRNRQIRVMRKMGQWSAALSYENGQDFLPALAHDSGRLHWEVKAVAARHHYGAAVAVVAKATAKIDIVAQQSWIQDGGRDALGTVPPGVATTATIGGIETRPASRLQVYGYGGFVRGSPSDGNRLVTEWTGGFWQEVQRDRYGAIVIGAQVSRVDRWLWDRRSGNQVFTMISLRRSLGPD
jgi:hypothetical protein